MGITDPNSQYMTQGLTSEEVEARVAAGMTNANTGDITAPALLLYSQNSF